MMRFNQMLRFGAAVSLMAAVEVSATTYIWESTAAGADWHVAANWAPDGTPRRVNSTTDPVQINTSPGATVYSGTASAWGLSLGNAAGQHGTLTVLGGAVSAQGLDIANAVGAYGTADFYGGSSSITYLCPGFRGHGTLNMYGGDITVTSQFRIAHYGPGSTGIVNLYGGTITTPFVQMSREGGTVSMRVRDGVLLVNGNAYLSTLQGYIDHGWITAAVDYTLVLEYNGTQYPGVTALYARYAPDEPDEPDEPTDPADRYSPADFNQDDFVDIVDLTVLASQWLGVPGDPSADIAPVPDSDGIVDLLDLQMLAAHWCPENVTFDGSTPSGLMCELLANPQTTLITDATPEFGWIVRSEQADEIQTAYQIRVSTKRYLLHQNNPDQWDSGKIASSNSTNVSYAGPALESTRSYFWTVRTWNRSDQVSGWSAVQEFKTGDLESGYQTARYKQVKTEVSPAIVSPIAAGHYLVDFGKDAFGYIRLTCPGSSGQVDVHFGETLKDGRVDRAPGGSIRYYMTPVTLNGSGEYEIHPQGTTVGIPIPAEFGRIAPFRYVELINVPSPVTAADITQVSIHYPFDDHAASFVCDDHTLNAVWELCKYSIKPTSFCAIYVDGDRERKPYEGDAYINQLSHYYTDREFALARYSHEYLMANPTWPTEWKHHSIMIAWADYLYTGNSESLSQNYTALKNEKLLHQYARSSDGLLNKTGLIDWPAGEQDGYVNKSINTVVNAFYYHTLLLMKQIADVLGHTADAQQFEQDAARIYQSFQAAFFNAGTGRYVDGEGTTHSSLHANMIPLAFGLVPADKKPDVVDFIKSKGMACSVYGAQYLLEGLYLAGEEDAAIALMTSDSARSWVNMMREGSTITLEAWGKAYKSNLDWNHAWGTAPANIIPRYFAGIRPLEPGFAKTLIHPQPGSLNQFQIKTPTLRGDILVSMDRQSDRCTFRITIPANMTARFVLPKNCDGYTSFSLDGNPVTLQQAGALRLIDPLASGNHVFEAR